MVIRPNSQRAPDIAPPSHFESDDGRIKGWSVEIPGGRTLATPAFCDGQIFLGGGFGSYEFYALDAESGHMRWQYRTHDDGPTAAVVEDGCVVFNTESCELEVLTTSGEPVWKQWLGDPLMSMPAIVAGRIYMAYPDSRGDRRHYLACFELTTGTLTWKQPIAGEIITAPVLADGAVYLTTLDGTLYCFARDGGQLLWQDAANATSTPVVGEGKCYYTQRKEIRRKGREPRAQQTEYCVWRSTSAGSPVHEFVGTGRNADYLDHAKRSAGSPVYAAQARFDASVGFGGSKGDAKIDQAMRHLGQAHVSGVWEYQGSKPFLSGGRLYNAMGDQLQSVDVHTEAIAWTRQMHQSSQDGELLDAVLTPPVLVNDKVFVGSRQGTLFCLAADTGKELWHAKLGEPIVFPPTVARGRVYVSTARGTLYGLETGDDGDDGWLMWGGTAAHNGLEELLRAEAGVALA